MEPRRWNCVPAISLKPSALGSTMWPHVATFLCRLTGEIAGYFGEPYNSAGIV
jgi:hypothetical protein